MPAVLRKEVSAPPGFGHRVAARKSAALSSFDYSPVLNVVFLPRSRSRVPLPAYWQLVDATSNSTIRSPPTNPRRSGTRTRIEGGSSCLPLSPGRVCALAAA